MWEPTVPSGGRGTQRPRGRESPEDSKVPWAGVKMDPRLYSDLGLSDLLSDLPWRADDRIAGVANLSSERSSHGCISIFTHRPLDLVAEDSHLHFQSQAREIF